MLNVYFNGEKKQVMNDISLQDLLLSYGFGQAFFAVSVNKKFIPKQNYQHHILNDNDVVDIIMPMQGG